MVIFLQRTLTSFVHAHAGRTQVCQQGQILATHFVLLLRVSITQIASQKLACYKGVSFKSNSIPISSDLLSHHNQQNERAQEKRHL